MVEEKKLWVIVFIRTENNNALPRGIDLEKKFWNSEGVRYKKLHRLLILHEETVKN